MQGKERNNRQIDAAFTDYAWSEMSNLLDKELPIAAPASKPKRRYASTLLILLIGFGAGVGTMALLQEDSTEKNNIETLPNFDPMKVADLKNLANQNKTNPATAESDQLIANAAATKDIEQNIRTKFTKPSKSNVNAGNFYTNSSSVIVENSFSVNAENSQNLDLQSKDQFSETNIYFEKPNEKILFDPKSSSKANETSEVINKRWTDAALTIESSSISMLTIPVKEYPLAFNLLEKAPRFSFGVGVGSHSRDLSGVHGWSAGLTASYRLDSKFALRSGLAYSKLTGFRTESLGINEPLTPEYFEPIEANLQEYSTVSSLENNQDLPFQSLHYIDLPVALHYKMSDKIGILMGLKTSYLIDAKMNGYIAANLNDNDQDLLDEALYNSMRKVDVATTLGFSFYPTSKVGVEFKYNHGLVDYTKDQQWHIRQLNTNKTFEMGLHYLLR